VPEVTIAHQFRERRPYAVRWADILHNTLRMAALHMSPARVRCLCSALSHHAALDTAIARLTPSDVWLRRERYLKRRTSDDSWFFDRFSLNDPGEHPGELTSGAEAFDRMLNLRFNDQPRAVTRTTP
jgi:hypothetical protein